jgi:hypothetical protein
MRSTETFWTYFWTSVGKLLLLLAFCSGSPPVWPAAPTAPVAIVPTEPGAVTIVPDGITYLAQGGDTLMSIARRLTTRPANWAAIGKLNRINQDSNIPIGTAIFIPAELLTDEPSAARVVALSGTITVTGLDGVGAPLVLGTIIVEGMQIETGGNGFVTLGLQDGSRISLPSNSRVRVAKLRMARHTKSPRTEIMLLRGRVESRVSPLESSKGRYEVRTPHSVAGVRGTHFRVGITEQGVTNEVLSGKVAVGRTADSTALTLVGGQGNLLDARKIGPAVALLPAPELADKTTRTYPAARFALTPVAGATTYRIQIAIDQDAENILAENRSSISPMTLDGIPDGNYFVRLSAIDMAGLEGATSTRPITLKKRAEAALATMPSPPFVDQSDERGFTLRWAAHPGQKFTLQVARDADFTWLLYNTTSGTAQARLPRPAFGTYYARVQAIEADGSSGPFSMAQPFIVTDQWIINDGNPVQGKEHGKDQGVGSAH